jgi:hypothetical protein
MPYIGHEPTNAGNFYILDDFNGLGQDGSSSTYDQNANGTIVNFKLMVAGVAITPNVDNLIVTIDGVLQHPTDAYSISGSILTFTEAPASGVDFHVVIMGQSATVGEGSIGADELEVSGDGTDGQLLKTDGDGTFSWINQNTVTASTANVATHVTVTDNESTNENNLLTFVEDASGAGNVGLESDGDLHYNPSTGRLTATQLAGTLQTAAQTNITSLGTLSSLTVSGQTRVGGAGSGSSENLLVTSATSSDHTRVHIEKTANAGSAGVSLNSYTPSASWTIYQGDDSDGDLIFYDDSDSVLTLATDNSATFAGALIVDPSSAVTSKISSYPDYNFEFTGGDQFNVRRDNGDSGQMHLNYTGGNVQFGQVTGNAHIMDNVQESAPAYAFKGDTNTGMGRVDSDKIGFFTGGTSRMTIDGSGNMVFGGEVYIRKDTAIHQANGDTNFTVKTTSAGDPSVILDSEAANRSGFVHFKDQGSAAGYIKYTHNGDSMNFHTANSGNPTLALIGDNARFVGLVEKATTGNFKLGAGEDADDPPYSFYADSNTGMFRVANGHVGICGVGVKVAEFKPADNDSTFGEMMLFSPRDGGQGCMITGYTTTDASDFAQIRFIRNGSSETSFEFRNHDTGNSTKTTKFYYNGLVYNPSDSSSWNTASDVRIKKDINDLTDAVDVLKKIRPISYKLKKAWTDEKGHEYGRVKNGFIADEYKDVFPNAVVADKNPVKVGNETYDNFLSLDQEDLVPYLVKAVQELSAKVEALENA